jgi:hypothetical protein
MRRMLQRRKVLPAARFALAVLCTAYTSPGNRGSPAPAHDANAIVVTRATPVRFHLRPFADLVRVAPRPVARYGQRLLSALDAVSALLSTGPLRSLNAELTRLDPRSGADGWLRAQALIPRGQGVR